MRESKQFQQKSFDYIFNNFKVLSKFYQFMQPYGGQEEENIGLFTFYRQQQFLEKGLKEKLKAQSLNRILKKVGKSIQKQKRNQSEPEKKSSKTCRQQNSLRRIVQQKQFPIKKKKEQLNTSSSTGNEKAVLKASLQIVKKKGSKTANSKEDFEIYNRVTKYLSQLDIMRVQKGQSKKINKQICYNFNNKTPQKKSVDQSNKNNNMSHFKKIALQPQQFEGLGEISKSVVAVPLHKRDKNGIKSYRKELKAQTEVTKIIQNQNSSVILVKINESLSQIKQNFHTNKLIRVHKILPKSESNQQQTVNKDIIKSQSLPRLKIHLPDILEKKQNTNVALSLEIMKNNQLKSKYKIKLIEKEDKKLIQNNQKIRNQIKQLRNSSQNQIKQYLSLRSSPKKQTKPNMNRQEQPKSIIQNSSLERKICEEQSLNKQEDLSSQKQKQIFCKRGQYLTRYKEKLKRNIFAMQREQEKKINCIKDQKKKEMLDNLTEKLIFL